MTQVTGSAVRVGADISERTQAGRLAATLLASASQLGILLISAAPLAGQSLDPLGPSARLPLWAQNASVVVPNDNRTPAGELRDGVLTVRLEARKGLWHPQGAGGPGFEIEAFGEAGGPLQSPGPAPLSE